MLVFRKIWRAFSWNTRFEIDPFCLITNDISNANLSDENIPVTVTELKHVLIFQQQLLIIIIMRKKEWSMKHRKHSLLPHKQPYIFFQTPIPFQLAKVISRCSLQKKRRSTKQLWVRQRDHLVDCRLKKLLYCFTLFFLL